MVFPIMGQPMSTINMSNKEAERLGIIAKIADHEWSYRKASQALRLSKRQLIRLVQRYREGGVSNVTHRNRGKTSPRKADDHKRREISCLIRSHYDDFGPTLITEQLSQRHGVNMSREWIRKLMVEEGLWKPKKQKELRLHQRRPRRSQEGELVQIDGSYAAWFEERSDKCCLLVAIDDATSKLQELRFAHHETREDYFALLKSYLQRRGKPVAVYTDRHSIFKTTRKYDCCEDTQFARAMKELDIELIHANSPQAKGRVERANGTLQDRLIKIMRLEGISSIEEGNKYLEVFREEYNKKFAKRAKNPIDAHRAVLQRCKMEKTLCVKEKRKLSKQLTLQFENKSYQLQVEKGGRRLIGATVLLYHSGDSVVIELEGKELKYSVYEEHGQNRIMDRKTINAFLDRKRPLTAIQRHRKKVALNF